MCTIVESAESDAVAREEARARALAVLDGPILRGADPLVAAAARRVIVVDVRLLGRGGARREHPQVGAARVEHHIEPAHDRSS